MQPKSQEVEDIWNSPIQDYHQLNDETLTFVLELSKTYFEETLKESEELTQRSTNMLYFMLPGAATIIAFCFTQSSQLYALNSFRLMLVLAATFGFLSSMYFLLKLMSAKLIHYKGNQPKNILREDVLNLGDPVIIEKALKIIEIEHYQVKIECMEAWNRQRGIFYKSSVYTFNAGGGIGVLAFLFSI